MLYAMPLVFVLKKKRLLSQQNVNKTSITQRRRPKKRKQLLVLFLQNNKMYTINVNDSNKNVTNFILIIIV